MGKKRRASGSSNQSGRTEEGKSEGSEWKKEVADKKLKAFHHLMAEPRKSGGEKGRQTSVKERSCGCPVP